MNCKEWHTLKRNSAKNLNWAYYNYVRSIQRSLQYNPDPNATVIHHLRDTEEQRKYNDERYELWGFEIDEDGNEHFEYGKYVIFVTEEWHTNYHAQSEETRKKIGTASKRNWSDSSYHTRLVQKLSASWTIERRNYHSDNFSKENAPWFGKSFSEQHRKNISESLKGEKNPMYGKPGINLGKHFSDEHRQRMSESQRVRFKNNPVSDETKHKQSISAKNHRSARAKLYTIYKSYGGLIKWNDFQRELSKGKSIYDLLEIEGIYVDRSEETF